MPVCERLVFCCQHKSSHYLGNSASNLRLVFYEKRYEQNKKYGTELDENWNRYELRFRQEMAASAVQELLRYRQD